MSEKSALRYPRNIGNQLRIYMFRFFRCALWTEFITHNTTQNANEKISHNLLCMASTYRSWLMLMCCLGPSHPLLAFVIDTNKHFYKVLHPQSQPSVDYHKKSIQLYCWLVDTKSMCSTFQLYNMLIACEVSSGKHDTDINKLEYACVLVSNVRRGTQVER